MSLGIFAPVAQLDAPEKCALKAQASVDSFPEDTAKGPDDPSISHRKQ